MCYLKRSNGLLTPTNEDNFFPFLNLLLISVALSQPGVLFAAGASDDTCFVEREKLQWRAVLIDHEENNLKVIYSYILEFPLNDHFMARL